MTINKKVLLRDRKRYRPGVAYPEGEGGLGSPVQSPYPVLGDIPCPVPEVPPIQSWGYPPVQFRTEPGTGIWTGPVTGLESTPQPPVNGQTPVKTLPSRLGRRTFKLLETLIFRQNF